MGKPLSPISPPPVHWKKIGNKIISVFENVKKEKLKKENWKDIENMFKFNFICHLKLIFKIDFIF